MKKLLALFALAILFNGNHAFSQNLFDSQLFLSNTSTLTLSHFHDWQNWTSFVQVSPTNKYALVEFGPKFNFPGGVLELRTGLNISAFPSGAKYVDQQALIFFLKRGKFQFLSVNEIKDISKNNFFHWSASQYYYKHDLKWGRIATRIEALWWEKNYKPFTGPTYSFTVGQGNLVIWPGWQIGKDKKIFVIEYNTQFK